MCVYVYVLGVGGVGLDWNLVVSVASCATCRVCRVVLYRLYCVRYVVSGVLCISEQPVRV